MQHWQFYTCGDGLFHKGKLWLGKQNWLWQVTCSYFASPGLPSSVNGNIVSSTAWLPNWQSQTNKKYVDMSGSVSVHRTDFKPSQMMYSGGEATDSMPMDGLCEESTLWYVVVWYRLLVGRMEEWTWGGAPILMSATGDNSFCGFWSLPSKHTCSLLC